MSSTTDFSYLVTGSECAALDAAVQAAGLSGAVLMTRAGTVAFAALQVRWPEAHRLLVLAGTGNNAGDSYVVAAKARTLGFEVRVLQVEGRTLDGPAGHWQREAIALGATVTAVAAPADLSTLDWTAFDVIVDGLLGIGLRSAPRPLSAALIEAANASPVPVLALDVPSGLEADRTGASGVVVEADLTCSFLAPKLCLHSGRGVALAGLVMTNDLGVSDRDRARFGRVRWLRTLGGERAPGQTVENAEMATARWPAAEVAGYKHARGHVVVVGGDEGMHGAVLLSAEAALRGGAGLVSVVTRGAAVTALLARRPELMVQGTERWPAALALLDRADVIVLGPGLGRGAWGRALFDAVRARSESRAVRLVLDADALFLLAGSDWHPGPQAVLTPHAGEAARLLGIDGQAIDTDRLTAVHRLVERYGAIALLKGPGTLVCAPKSDPRASPDVWCIGFGNPGMATAGMGDVLAGIIGARLALEARSAAADLLVPGLGAAVAAAAAVHGAAADLALANDCVGSTSALVASDVLHALPAVLARAEGVSRIGDDAETSSSQP